MLEQFPNLRCNKTSDRESRCKDLEGYIESQHYFFFSLGTSDIIGFIIQERKEFEMLFCDESRRMISFSSDSKTLSEQRSCD